MGSHGAARDMRREEAQVEWASTNGVVQSALAQGERAAAQRGGAKATRGCTAAAPQGDRAGAHKTPRTAPAGGAHRTECEETNLHGKPFRQPLSEFLRSKPL